APDPLQALRDPRALPEAAGLVEGRNRIDAADRLSLGQGQDDRAQPSASGVGSGPQELAGAAGAGPSRKRKARTLRASEVSSAPSSFRSAASGQRISRPEKRKSTTAT